MYTLLNKSLFLAFIFPFIEVNGLVGRAPDRHGSPLELESLYKGRVIKSNEIRAVSITRHQQQNEAI